MAENPAKTYRLKKGRKRTGMGIRIARYWLGKIMGEYFTANAESEKKRIVAAFLAFDRIYETGHQIKWKGFPITTVDFNRKQVIELAKKYGANLSTRDVSYFGYALNSFGIFHMSPGSGRRSRSFLEPEDNHPRNLERHRKSQERLEKLKTNPTKDDAKFTLQMRDWLYRFRTVDPKDQKAVSRLFSEVGNERKRIQKEGNDEEQALWVKFDRRWFLGAPRAVKVVNRTVGRGKDQSSAAEWAMVRASERNWKNDLDELDEKIDAEMRKNRK